MDVAPGGALSRQIARPLSTVFHGIFTESSLTKIQKIKQFIQCLAYDAGKRVARMPRMTEQNLTQEMNKAYYMRVQVLFADIDDDSSYWKKHFGFNFTFGDMMTHTFGAGQPTYFFDYQDNDELDEGQLSNLKNGWNNPFLWRKYGELKTEMQSHMLPVLMKERGFKSVAGGDGYVCGSGASFNEVFYNFLGKLFQSAANKLYEDRVRKRQRPAAAAAEGQAAAAAPENDEDASEQLQAAPAIQPAMRPQVRDAPDRWGDAHVAWRHPSLFVFVLNGPLTHFHPDPGSRTVCEFLKKVPRSGPAVDAPADRPVEAGDSRRRQRRHDDRNGEREQAGNENRDFIQQLALSRQSQDRAAQESNELFRLQIQMQFANMQQQNRQNRLQHIQDLREGINQLNNLPPGMQLSVAQKKAKENMEQQWADAIVALGRVPADPLAAISAEIANMRQPLSALHAAAEPGLENTVQRAPFRAGGSASAAAFSFSTSVQRAPIIGAGGSASAAASGNRAVSAGVISMRHLPNLHANYRRPAGAVADYSSEDAL